MKIILQTVALFLIIVVGLAVLSWSKIYAPQNVLNPSSITVSTSTTPAAEATTTVPAIGISVSSPSQGQAISSPLKISGEALGSWYFEAVFPVVVVDWDGRIIGEGQAHASKDWTSPGPIPFTGTIDFVKPAYTGTQSVRGAVIFKNDNPSGDPAKSKAIEVPVTFK